MGKSRGKDRTSSRQACARKDPSLLRQILPFDSCNLSLSTASEPVVTMKGTLFDRDVIHRFIEDYGVDPTTGGPLSKMELFPLQFRRTEDGVVCPASHKVFSENSHIQVNTKTGSVFAGEVLTAVHAATGCWEDPVTGEEILDPGRDVVDLQKSDKLVVRLLEKFDTRKVRNPAKREKKEKHMRVEGKRDAVCERKEQPAEHDRREPYKYALGGLTGERSSRHTEGTTAMSTTSTAVGADTRSVFRDKTAQELRVEMYQYMRSYAMKAYVIIETSCGQLAVQLHCNYAPMACHNFLGLVRRAFYNNCRFYRIVPDFMAQTGDPTGSGRGGICAFSDLASFRDEFHPDANHDARGVLGYANTGPNSNRSQFYITFRATPQLDRKHSVFGQVIEGEQTLKTMESYVGDSPDEFPTIVRIQISEDPFFEWLNDKDGRLPPRERKKISEERSKKDPGFGSGLKRFNLI